MRKIDTIRSTILIDADEQTVWQHITDVDITAFAHPPLLGLLGIPQPLHAEVLSEGVGGQRVSTFENGKRFFQEITAWEPPVHYAFTFQPEKGFRVVYLFDLADGVFQMQRGAYHLMRDEDGVLLSLTSWVSLRGPFMRLLALPVRLILRNYQRFLLRSIARNVKLSRS